MVTDFAPEPVLSVIVASHELQARKLSARTSRTTGELIVRLGFHGHSSLIHESPRRQSTPGLLGVLHETRAPLHRTCVRSSRSQDAARVCKCIRRLQTDGWTPAAPAALMRLVVNSDTASRVYTRDSRIDQRRCDILCSSCQTAEIASTTVEAVHERAVKKSQQNLKLCTR
jgi:hypothetical protein